MAQSVDLAEALAEQLNTIPFKWPNPDPNQPGFPAAHLVTNYATAKAAVIPTIQRKDSRDLRIIVSPPPDTRKESAGKDRCRRRWQYGLNLAVVQRIDESDTDFEQPMTLAHIKSLIGFTEAIGHFIDANRVITSMRASLTSLDQISYDNNELRDHHLFLSTTIPVYTIS